ncbi:MAG: HIT family protein [Chlamydiota bacterium]
MLKKFCFFVVFLYVTRIFGGCPFCDPKIIAQQKYVENEYAIGVYDIKPYFKGHCLIIPKRHIERYSEMTNEEAAAVLDLVKKTDIAVQKSFHTNSYLILQRNGKEVGQSVFHLHVHYIPNYEDSSPAWFYFRVFFCDPFARELSAEENRATIDLLRKNVPHS